MTWLLAGALLLSVGMNLRALVQVRRHRAALRYARLDFQRFADEAEERLARHEALLEDTRAKVRSLESGEGGR
ncbi:MAG: hypothetical protein AB1505_21975 [Candidatus Latescibacterota bacterium]